jgi:hypothetical protein
MDLFNSCQQHSKAPGGQAQSCPPHTQVLLWAFTRRLPTIRRCLRKFLGEEAPGDESLEVWAAASVHLVLDTESPRLPLCLGPPMSSSRLCTLPGSYLSLVHS